MFFCYGQEGKPNFADSTECFYENISYICTCTLNLPGTSIPHENVYKMIRQNTSGELAGNCRHRMKYHRRPSHRHETIAPSIKNRVSIHERPREANGKRFGDREMALIVDKDNNTILTMIERSTNFLIMEDSNTERKPCWQRPYGDCLCPTREKISRLSLTVYFTDDYSSWQKGGIENTNKLI